MDAREALLQAKARAEWDADVPKSLNPGDPPYVAPEAAQTAMAFDGRWLLEAVPDDGATFAVWEREWKRVLSLTTPTIDPLGEKVVELEQRIAVLEKRQP